MQSGIPPDKVIRQRGYFQAVVSFVFELINQSLRRCPFEFFLWYHQQGLPADSLANGERIVRWRWIPIHRPTTHRAGAEFVFLLYIT